MTDDTISEPYAQAVQTLVNRSVVMPGQPRQAGLYTPEQMAGWRKVTRAVHANGGRMFVQLWYVGCHTRAPRADGLPDVVDDFRLAAAQAIAAGFDGVELHVTNGLQLEKFLNEGSWQRTDAHGFSGEQRARLLLEVVAAVVNEIGADRTAVLVAPESPVKGISFSDAPPQYSFIVGQLGVAYLRVAKGASRGPRDATPFDVDALRAHSRPVALRTWRPAPTDISPPRAIQPARPITA